MNNQMINSQLNFVKENIPITFISYGLIAITNIPKDLPFNVLGTQDGTEPENGRRAARSYLYLFVYDHLLLQRKLG